LAARGHNQDEQQAQAGDFAAQSIYEERAGNLQWHSLSGMLGALGVVVKGMRRKLM
jgi:hypothetical protein